MSLEGGDGGELSCCQQVSDFTLRQKRIYMYFFPCDSAAFLLLNDNSILRAVVRKPWALSRFCYTN